MESSSFLTTFPLKFIYFPMKSGKDYRTYKEQKEITTLYITNSAAQVTKSYSRRLPALERFYWETKFSYISRPT